MMDAAALDHLRELAEGCSAGFLSYLDFTVESRLALEAEVDEVMALLDRAKTASSDLAKQGGGASSVAAVTAADEAAKAGDRELLRLLEARNEELEGQLTVAWDELLASQGRQEALASELTAGRRALADERRRAAAEVSEARAGRQQYKVEVAAMSGELEAKRAEVGALHEQVDALTQKLQMEEASKKSLKAQFEKANRAAQAESKRAAAAAVAQAAAAQVAARAAASSFPDGSEPTEGQRREVRRKLRRALNIRGFASATTVFLHYVQVRWLQLKFSAVAHGVNSGV